MESFVTISKDILTMEGGQKTCLVDMERRYGQEPQSTKENSTMELKMGLACTKNSEIFSIEEVLQKTNSMVSEGYIWLMDKYMRDCGKKESSMAQESMNGLIIQFTQGNF